MRSPSKEYYRKKSNIANKRPLFFNKTSVVTSDDQQSNASLDASWESRMINRSDAMTDKIDFLAIFLFLFSYFLFNCIYVAYYVWYGIHYLTIFYIFSMNHSCSPAGLSIWNYNNNNWNYLIFSSTGVVCTLSKTKGEKIVEQLIILNCMVAYGSSLIKLTDIVSYNIYFKYFTFLTLWLWPSIIILL